MSQRLSLNGRLSYDQLAFGEGRGYPRFFCKGLSKASNVDVMTQGSLRYEQQVELHPHTIF